MSTQKRYAAALLTRNDQVLLGKRSATRKTYPGQWDLLGGHCETDESFEHCMIREIEEECGVVPTKYQLLRTIDIHGDFIMAVYHITSWTGEVYNAEPKEHDAVEWQDIDTAIAFDFPEPEYAILLTELMDRIQK